MSYILDALKKAERERHVAKVPTLDTVHRTPGVGRYPRWWMWVGAAVVLANAGLLMWFLRPASMTDRSPHPAPLSVVSGPAALPPTSADRPAPASAPVPPTTVRPPAPAVPASRPTAATASRSDSQPSPSPAVGPGAPRTEPGRSPAPEAPGRAQAPSPERAVPAPQTPGLAPALPTPTPAAPQPVPPPQRAPIAPTPGKAPVAVASAPPAVERGPAAPGRPPAPGSPAAPGIQELTPAEQEGMPKISLQFLVYSEVPSERLIFVNNQKYVEGQSIEGKIVVEGILPDGAILSYQGKRFKLRQ